MHPQLHHVSTNRGSCPPLYLPLLAGTSRKSLALQYLTEQRNPPKKDQPCPLAESIAKLSREVGFYLSFMDEEVFWGVDLPKEEENKPSAPTATAADAPGATATVETLPTQRVTPDYTRWNTILHPS